MNAKNKSPLFFCALVRALPLVLLASLYLLPQSVAAYAYVSLNTMTYQGDWEKFDTLAEAQANVDGTETLMGIIGTRDVKLKYQDNYYLSNEFTLATAFDLDGAGGARNPSNQNPGFLQIKDVGATTVTSSSYSFIYPDTWGFQLALTGENAQRGSSGQNVRTGVGPSPGIDNSDGAGDWLYYNFDFTFSGLNVVNYGLDASSEGIPEDVSGTGFILFENTDSGQPDSNGFYRINLTFGNDSWAVANSSPDLSSVITSDQIPEPSSFALLAGLVAAGTLFVRRGGRAGSSLL